MCIHTGIAVVSGYRRWTGEVDSPENSLSNHFDMSEQHNTWFWLCLTIFLALATLAGIVLVDYHKRLEAVQQENRKLAQRSEFYRKLYHQAILQERTQQAKHAAITADLRRELQVKEVQHQYEMSKLTDDLREQTNQLSDLEVKYRALQEDHQQVEDRLHATEKSLSISRDSTEQLISQQLLRKRMVPQFIRELGAGPAGKPSERLINLSTIGLALVLLFLTIVGTSCNWIIRKARPVFK